MILNFVLSKFVSFIERFAELRQTDHGISAVLSWAKEGNLGPEVKIITFQQI